MSGVIYGAIVVMWLAFLVPMWLKRHDEAAEPKPVERATIAMRVLSRRRRVAGDDELVVVTAVSSSSIQSSAADEVSGRRTGMAARLRSSMGRLHVKRDPLKLVSTSAAPVGRTTRKPPSAAGRRQRILVTLCALTVLLAAVAGLGRLPWLAVAPAAALLVGYVALLAVHGRSVARAGRTLQVARPATGSMAAVVPSSGRVDHDAETFFVEDATTTSTAVATASAHRFTDRATSEPVSAPVPDGFAGPRLGWDPVPVPSPTYVSAPRAPRAVRSIDLSRDDAWTSGRLVAAAKAAATAAVARSGERQDDSELERRAVGD